MTNPPTQGREAEAKQLFDEHESGTCTCEFPNWCLFEAGYKAGQAVDAAYPEQTEGDEREWTVSRHQSWAGMVIQGPLPHDAEHIPVVPKSRLIAAEQERDNQRKRAEKAELDNGILAERVVKAERERGDLRIELDLMTNDRDACWRECERLRETLREMKNSAKFLSCGCAFAIPQQVDAVLDAAYPEHSKPNEPIILTEEQAEKYEELVKRRSKPVGTPLPLDPEQTEGKEKLEKAERELADARSQHLLLSNQTLDATQRAEKAERERDEAMQAHRDDLALKAISND